MTPDPRTGDAKSADRDRASLEDLLTSARLACQYVADTGKDQFTSDQQLQDAVVRRVELVGEAARRVSQAGRQRWAHLPWREMIGMRNIVIHDYDEIDWSIIWETVERDLPELIAEVERALAES